MTEVTGKTARIRVLVVDDHKIVCDGLHFLLDQEDDIEIVGETCDGRQAVDLVGKLHPDVVIMDIGMPNLDGVGATRQIVQEHPDIKVLALSAHSDRRSIESMIKAGTRGYLLKADTSTSILKAIHTVMDGHLFLCPEATEGIVRQLMGHDDPATPYSVIDQLSYRERELLQLLAEGQSNKQAARILHINVKTVDARRRSIMDKSDCDNIADLTRLAIREELVSAD